jgi:predicted DNA-binding transcriptional regulator YafY
VRSTGSKSRQSTVTGISSSTQLIERLLSAAPLAAQWVAAQGDAALAKGARDLVAKIGAVVPERLRPFVLEPATGAPARWDNPPDRLHMSRLRTCIHSGRKIALRYRDEHDRESERIVWPVIVGYLDAVRHLIAWCELSQDFRNFRTDRVIEAEFLDQRYPERPSALKAK